MSTMVDQTSLEELLGRFVTDLGATIAAGNVLTGDRLGLYRGLHEGGPATSAELAARVGVRGNRYNQQGMSLVGR